MLESRLPEKVLVPQITVQGKGTLTKLQREFNSKVNRINALKNQLAERQALVVQARTRVEAELRPLVRQLVAKRIELVKLLDRSYDIGIFRKRERDKIAYLIIDIASSLIEAHGVAELVSLHDTYADVPYAEAVHQGVGERMEEPDFEEEREHPEGTTAYHDGLERQQEEPERGGAARESAGTKTKAQIAKEEKAKAELHNISKASRRLYTDLVKLLHPDREQDEAVKLWKEEAMKQITSAYKQDDFFELLRLQTEHTREQGSGMSELPEKQLKYYLKILNQQVRELEAEHAAFNLSPEGNFYRLYCGAPQQMDQKFGTARNDLKKELKRLERDLQHLEDPTYLRAFLKELRFS